MSKEEKIITLTKDLKVGDHMRYLPNYTGARETLGLFEIKKIHHDSQGTMLIDWEPIVLYGERVKAEQNTSRYDQLCDIFELDTSYELYKALYGE